MTGFFGTFMYKILVLLMSFYSLFASVAAPATTDTIKSKDPDSVKLTAVFWGDTQVSDYMLSRQLYVKNSCIDVANSEEKIDALIHVGDVTENGKKSEYNLLLDDFSVIDNVDNYLMTVGNHDVRLRLYSQAKSTFTEFRKVLDPAYESDTLYYSKDINGYKFIILATVTSEFEESYFDEKCLTWLDAQLCEATKDGMPVFVVCHQPLAFTNGLPDTWGSPFDSAGSVGAQSDALREIMAKYKNVFFLTGHLHTGFGEYTYDEADGTHLINVPSLGIKNADGLEDRGLGFMIEVYENEVLFRARNFSTGMYLPEYDMAYPIV